MSDTLVLLATDDKFVMRIDFENVVHSSARGRGSNLISLSWCAARIGFYLQLVFGPHSGL